MTKHPVERTNQGWIDDLSAVGVVQDLALADLGEIIRRGLPYSLSKYLSPQDPQFDGLAEEVVQDTLLRVLDHLGTFEGRSKFTTWVHKIAVRIALTELRRKRWKDISLDELMDTSEAPASLSMMADLSHGPETSAERAEVAGKIQKIIDEDLTERQRTALLAIGVQGMPMPVVADRMNMKRNALYKLLHDARLKLKSRLTEEGLPPEDILSVFSDQ